MLKALYEEEKEKEKGDKSKISALQNALKSSDKIETLKCHQEPIENLYTSLNSNPEKGLTTQTAGDRLKSEGLNQLKEKKQLPWIVRLLKEMIGVFSDLLWAGSVLSFIAYGLDKSDTSNVRALLVIPWSRYRYH
jgi:magnesium-transporting ATPase (P-type)